MKISGSVVALITPMHNDRIDFGALQDLVKWHSTQGTDAIVVVGSTGEGSMLSEGERSEAISAVVSQNNALANRMQIIAGCGTISTRDTVTMVQNAEKCGVDAVMVVSPCYVRPTQEGLYLHFKMVAENVGVPVVLYNHPGRTAVSLQSETIVRLCHEFENVIAVKDSSPDLSRIATLRMDLPERVSLLSGDDATNVGFLAQGGSGIISVTANVFPRLCKEFMQAWQHGDIAAAVAIHQRLMPMHTAMFCEPNPGPVVYATATQRGFHNEVRMPLLPVIEGSKSAKVIDFVVEKITCS
ncbi:MAG: 4-hydroxy-tetrahydrodipicolinate synthase [Holosporales bacterium]|jgi:4-hydroxy-tetrahydrodipicolinate synthase|nr:4-hydroxy-tetrahydrodipicolinate synthase [Holosporales bacterium]